MVLLSTFFNGVPNPEADVQRRFTHETFNARLAFWRCAMPFGVLLTTRMLPPRLSFTDRPADGIPLSPYPLDACAVVLGDPLCDMCW